MSDDLGALAQQEAVLSAIHKTISERLEACRAAVQRGIDGAASTLGVSRIDAKLPDGTVVARISLVEPKPKAHVTDDAAFLAWVRETYPDEIERQFVTVVRPAFSTKLLAEMTKSGAAYDPATGEVVPGVAFKTASERTHSLRFGARGRDDVAAAWRAGQLTHVVLPELSGGAA